MNNTNEIKELFIQLSRGDVKAYDAIFHNYYVPLVLFSNSFICDKENAEDIVSEVFCNLWSAREKYKDIAYGQSYLFSSVKNRSIDFIRSRKKMMKEPLNENIELDLDESDFFEIELYSKLKNIIELLPEKCSDIMRLKLDGLSDKEISEKIGVKFETVRSHQKRGFMLMRSKIDKMYVIILFV